MKFILKNGDKMTITKDVDISMDIDLNLTVDEIYNNLSSTEKEDLFEILSEYKSRNNTK